MVAEGIEDVSAGKVVSDAIRVDLRRQLRYAS